jgi:hypothetical protein
MWKFTKKTSCKSVNMYLSIYLRGVILGFLLSFCANSSSFVLNQAFDLFFCRVPRSQHPLLMAHCSLIFFARFSLNLSHLLNLPLFLPMAMKPCFGYSPLFYSEILIDPGFMSFRFPTKPLKLSSLLVNQKETQHIECVTQSHPR